MTLNFSEKIGHASHDASKSLNNFKIMTPHDMIFLVHFGMLCYTLPIMTVNSQKYDKKKK